MTSHRALRALTAGILVANAVPHASPHAYAAAVGAQQLTPLAGRQSGPRTNALSSALNLAGAVALTRPLDAGSATERQAFKVGVVAFAAWGLASEWLTDLNG